MRPPQAAATATLTGVRTSGSGVWITGQQITGGQQSGVLLHGTGAAWTVITTQSPVSELNDVLAISARDLWAVGAVSEVIHGLSLTLPWRGHWNGAAWDASLQIPAGQVDGNFTITPDAAGRPQWVGSTTGISPASTRYAYFNGTTWTEVTGAPLTGAFVGNTYTAHIPGTNATWSVTAAAVDTAQGIGPSFAQIERNDGWAHRPPG